MQQVYVVNTAVGLRLDSVLALQIYHVHSHSSYAVLIRMFYVPHYAVFNDPIQPVLCGLVRQCVTRSGS